VTTYVEARFTGRYDPDYHYNQLYQLRLQQYWGGKIRVTATHGYHCMPLAGMTRTYAQLNQFLQEWLITRVVRPSE